MKHPTEELIISYLYNELNDSEIEEMEKHIAVCRECAIKIKDMKKTIFSLTQIKETTLPDFLEDRIADSLKNLTINSENTFVQKNKPDSSSEIMTPAELAEFLKLPVKAIYEILNDIPHLSLAGQIRFRKSSIDKWLESREKNMPSKKYIPQDFNDSVKLWRIVV
ncbi:MAG: helix-turn-helix domain-containing protein [Candidatus Wallbacteria bacterium]